MTDKLKNQALKSISVSIFSDLSSDHQQLIIEQTTQISVKAGQTLIKEGDHADTLYFLKQGSLIVYSKEKPIAEISAGEPIGEIAFFTDGTRTATVIASRNCKLLQLDKKAYSKLIKDIPELTQSIIQALAQRLTANNITAPELEPKVSKVIALLPAGDCRISDEFIKQLLSLKNDICSSWKVIQANDIDNTEQLAEWVEQNEDPSCQLIMIASGSIENTEITQAMAEHADKSYFILDNTLQKNHPISSFEERVYENSVLNNIDLVILRQNTNEKISATSAILNGRQIHLHHHVAMGHQLDLERLQRFIAGKAIGLVLCGGGAFGSAHLGMIKALQEQEYNFDIIGGTSVGSAVTALCALGNNPDEALQHLDEMFVKQKAFGKYSIPLYSFIDHKHFDNEVKRAAGNIDIEDLPINFFAVATNLSQNQLHVIRKGPLWQAVRSSCSIPGILPPYINTEGEVLIDGAVMDNTPIKTLRSLKTGPNIVMNFRPLKTWKVNADYEEMPSGLALLKRIVFPKRKQHKYYPTIFAILSRTMVTNTTRRFAEIDRKDDIFLEPKRLPRMGMMNWKRSREQFDLSYNQMNSALAEQTDIIEKDKLQLLKVVSENMKRKKNIIDD